MFCITFTFLLLLISDRNGYVPLTHSKQHYTNWRSYKTDTEYDMPLAKLHYHDSPHVATMTPRTVHYIWCSNDTGGQSSHYFRFQHFLGMLSIIRYVTPDVIYFYYHQIPGLDRHKYNTWFTELVDLYPFLVPIKTDRDVLCSKLFKPKVEFIQAKVREKGGMYISENTVLTESVTRVLVSPQSLLAYSQEGDLCLVSTGHQRGVTNLNLTLNSSKSHRRQNTIIAQCTARRNMKTTEGDTSACIHLDNSNDFYPSDLWGRDDPFSRLGRFLMYSSELTPSPMINSEEVVPRIAHYFWMGGGDMDYLFYLSILSVIHVLKVTTVYIHGDAPLQGQYWLTLQETHSAKVIWIHKSRPGHVFGQPVMKIAHEADIAACDVMIRYGGVHMDPDLIFTKALPDEFWRYDAMSAPSQADNMPYPLIINWGLFLTRPYGRFYTMVQRSERDFLRSEWNWNSARLVYKIYERNPDLLVLHPLLQVQCFRLECIPRWQDIPRRQSDILDPKYYLKSNKRTEGLLWSLNVSEWMHIPYSFHFTDPTPAELLNMEATMSNTGPFAQIGQIVLRAAGLM